eukprot:m51a1_g12835 hypothetical protein (94) ;mRNA; f:2348-3017
MSQRRLALQEADSATQQLRQTLDRIARLREQWELEKEQEQLKTIKRLEDEHRDREERLKRDLTKERDQQIEVIVAKLEMVRDALASRGLRGLW